MHRIVLFGVAAAMSITSVFGGGIVTGAYNIATYSIPNSGILNVEQISDNKEIVGFISLTSGNTITGPFQGFVFSQQGGTTPIVDPADGTSTFTRAYGINNQKTVVGEYFDSVNVQYSGFLYSNGSFTSYNLPGLSSQSTTAILGINDRGDLCGFYLDSSNFSVVESFLTTKKGDVVPIVISPTFTQATAINNQDVVVGVYEDASGVFHGFIRQAGGSTETVDVPGASTAPGLGTVILGVNEAGWVSGHFWDSSNAEHGFTRSPQGQFYQVDVPLPGVTATGGGGLNNQGIFVGHYNIGSAEYLFVATPR